MINLINKIKEKIETVHQRVYIEELPINYKYPYVLIKFPTSNENNLKQDFILEVDIYDNTKKQIPITLENITNNIDSVLNRSKIIENDFYCIIKRINRLMIPDSEPNVRRRQLRYQVTTQFR